MIDDVEIKGTAELKRVLGELPVTVERNISRGALRAGAGVFVGEIEATAPRDTGAMASRVAIRSGAKRNGRIWAHAEVQDPKAHLVEFGTRPHEIKPRSSPSLFFAGLFRRLIKHPGAKPKPFVRPAFDNKVGAATEAVSAYIRARLEKLGKRT